MFNVLTASYIMTCMDSPILLYHEVYGFTNFCARGQRASHTEGALISLFGLNRGALNREYIYILLGILEYLFFRKQL